MAALTLHLHRPWFDAIAHGHKTVEYRRVTPYWQTRIENRSYDKLILQNGSGERYPTMEVEYKGYDIYTDHDGTRYYRLKLGAITRVRNYAVVAPPAAAEGGGGAAAACVDLNGCFHPDDHKRCMRRCRATGTWRPRALDVRVVADPIIHDAPEPPPAPAPLSSPSMAAGGPPAAAPAADGDAGKVIGEAIVPVV